MKLAVAADWVEAPLKRFLDDARAQLAVLLHPSGLVLGQFGFTRSVDVMTACVLSAAIHASSAELGLLVDGKPFTGLHYAGKTRQLFLGRVPAADGALILLTVFDDESSFGLVQLFFQEFRASIAAASPASSVQHAALTEDFEHELNRNLAKLFGRA